MGHAEVLLKPASPRGSVGFKRFLSAPGCFIVTISTTCQWILPHVGYSFCPQIHKAPLIYNRDSVRDREASFEGVYASVAGFQVSEGIGGKSTASVSTCGV